LRKTIDTELPDAPLAYQIAPLLPEDGGIGTSVANEDVELCSVLDDAIVLLTAPVQLVRVEGVDGATMDVLVKATHTFSALAVSVARACGVDERCAVVVEEDAMWTGDELVLRRLSQSSGRLKLQLLANRVARSPHQLIDLPVVVPHEVMAEQALVDPHSVTALIHGASGINPLVRVGSPANSPLMVKESLAHAVAKATAVRVESLTVDGRAERASASLARGSLLSSRGGFVADYGEAWCGRGPLVSKWPDPQADQAIEQLGGDASRDIHRGVELALGKVDSTQREVVASVLVKGFISLAQTSSSEPTSAAPTLGFLRQVDSSCSVPAAAAARLWVLFVSRAVVASTPSLSFLSSRSFVSLLKSLDLCSEAVDVHSHAPPGVFDLDRLTVARAEAIARGRATGRGLLSFRAFCGALSEAAAVLYAGAPTLCLSRLCDERLMHAANASARALDSVLAPLATAWPSDMTTRLTKKWLRDLPDHHSSAASLLAHAQSLRPEFALPATLVSGRSLEQIIELVGGSSDSHSPRVWVDLPGCVHASKALNLPDWASPGAGAAVAHSFLRVMLVSCTDILTAWGSVESVAPVGQTSTPSLLDCLPSPVASRLSDPCLSPSESLGALLVATVASYPRAIRATSAALPRDIEERLARFVAHQAEPGMCRSVRRSKGPAGEATARTLIMRLWKRLKTTTLNPIDPLTGEPRTAAAPPSSALSRAAHSGGERALGHVYSDLGIFHHHSHLHKEGDERRASHPKRGSVLTVKQTRHELVLTMGGGESDDSSSVDTINPIQYVKSLVHPEAPTTTTTTTTTIPAAAAAAAPEVELPSFSPSESKHPESGGGGGRISNRSASFYHTEMSVKAQLLVDALAGKSSRRMTVAEDRPLLRQRSRLQSYTGSSPTTIREDPLARHPPTRSVFPMELQSEELLDRVVSPPAPSPTDGGEVSSPPLPPAGTTVTPVVKEIEEPDVTAEEPRTVFQSRRSAETGRLAEMGLEEGKLSLEEEDRDRHPRIGSEVSSVREPPTPAIDQQSPLPPQEDPLEAVQRSGVVVLPTKVAVMSGLVLEAPDALGLLQGWVELRVRARSLLLRVLTCEKRVQLGPAKGPGRPTSQSIQERVQESVGRWVRAEAAGRGREGGITGTQLFDSLFSVRTMALYQPFQAYVERHRLDLVVACRCVFGLMDLEAQWEDAMRHLKTYDDKIEEFDLQSAATHGATGSDDRRRSQAAALRSWCEAEAAAGCAEEVIAQCVAGYRTVTDAFFAGTGAEFGGAESAPVLPETRERVCVMATLSVAAYIRPQPSLAPRRLNLEALFPPLDKEEAAPTNRIAWSVGAAAAAASAMGFGLPAKSVLALRGREASRSMNTTGGGLGVFEDGDTASDIDLSEYPSADGETAEEEEVPENSLGGGVMVQVRRDVVGVNEAGVSLRSRRGRLPPSPHEVFGHAKHQLVTQLLRKVLRAWVASPEGRRALEEQARGGEQEDTDSEEEELEDASHAPESDRGDAATSPAVDDAEEEKPLSPPETPVALPPPSKKQRWWQCWCCAGESPPATRPSPAGQ
jgi:hypothetical protein